MSRLNKFSKSDLMNIKITYNGEIFRFNLYDEVRISEASLNKEIKVQPSYYGFISMLHTRITNDYNRLLHKRDLIGDKLFLRAKKTLVNGRFTSDDVATKTMATHPKYVALEDKVLATKATLNILNTCLKSFEQRKDLLQTLASNIRRQV